MKHKLLRSLFLASFLALLLSGSGAAEEPRYEWDGISRIVAVGDVHGAYDNFVRVLQNAGLIDDDLDWIGGETHLVQNGDVVDRGPESRKTMDLMMELEEQAEKAGGKLHALIGNHEAMNIVGILDLVSDEEFESYVDRDSRRRREITFERYYDRLREEAKANGERAPKKSQLWEEFQEEYPLGYIEHRHAFSADGRYGKWILSHNTAVKINGIVFSHGDWSAKFSEIGIEEVNRRVRQELSGELPLEEGLTFDPESPLQYRGLTQTTLTRAAQSAVLDRVDRILENLGAKRMVVGHTITSGVIESRFGGKHISIDLGMLELYRGGHRAALEIRENELFAVHDQGVVRIPETMDETNFDDYLRAVAEVAPDNLDVQLKLVDIHREEGRTAEAVAILERLLRKGPDFVPIRYREFLGSYYAEEGREGRARKEFVAYIEALSQVIDSHPGNANLANLLARFCIDKGLKLDLAERAIGRALEEAPEHHGFQLTLARLHIARERFEEALGVLSVLPEEESGLAYELHYWSGVAYLGLEETDKARAAFEQAILVEPEREEAREELRKLEQLSNVSHRPPA